MVVDHVIPQQFHPLLILAIIHMTAPFANQQRCNIFGIDICPSIIPIIIQQSLFREILIKPSLVINRRTIVMRRIDNLACTGIRLNRIIPNATQIAAPPCRNIRWVSLRIRLPPSIGITLHRLFHAFNENQSIRVDIQNRIGTFCCCICPVVFIGRAIPLCSSCTLLTFSVRFIFQVVANQRIIIFVLICQPCQRFNPQIRGNHCPICGFLAIP